MEFCFDSLISVPLPVKIHKYLCDPSEQLEYLNVVLMYMLPMVQYHHPYLDLGEKMNSSPSDDFRF